MAMKLMYITNSPQVAVTADKCGVDRIFVDLEKVGKSLRQANRDTVISSHDIEDIGIIKPLLKKAQLIVRTNPIHEGSGKELAAVKNSLADIVMLPYFSTAKEAEYFISAFDGKKKICLLFETPDSVKNAEEILSVGGIDEVFVGLNDLHIGYGMDFLFEPLANGIMDKLCDLFAKKGVPYGFGGMARLNQGTLSAKQILGEHYRLGSDCVILSRSFCDTSKITNAETLEEIFDNGIKEIRDYERFLTTADSKFFEDNRKQLIKRVEEIARANRG